MAALCLLLLLNVLAPGGAHARMQDRFNSHASGDSGAAGKAAQPPGARRFFPPSDFMHRRCCEA